MCCANLVRKWPCVCLKTWATKCVVQIEWENSLACVLKPELLNVLCTLSENRTGPYLYMCCIHNVQCLKPQSEEHLCPFLTISWCAPHRNVHTYVCAWQWLSVWNKRREEEPTTRPSWGCHADDSKGRQAMWPWYVSQECITALNARRCLMLQFSM